MAYYLVVAGGTLYRMTTAGVATALTLPTGVTIDTSKSARMAVFGRNVAIVNAPSRSIWVDPFGVVRPMGLTPPISPPNLAAGTTGTLSGTFRARFSHRVKDSNGAVLMESELSPISVSAQISSKLLAASGISASIDAETTHRMCYRTTTGPGSAYLPWIEVEGNTINAISDDTPDAALATLAAPTELGTPPGTAPGTFMSVVAEWKSRLWGVGNLDIDFLRFSGDSLIYGWPSSYSLPVPPLGDDVYGVTALIRRRDELGVARRKHLYKVAGSKPSNFEIVQVIAGKGVVATDSVQVIRDVAYFLGEDGVYTWSTDGVKSISDDKVKGWFTTDTYFNRSRFSSAFGVYNPRYHCYELHLSAAGSSTNDRWVVYDILTGEWFGPHQTKAFTPTIGGTIVDPDATSIPVVGASNGYVYQMNQTAFNDDGSSIALAIIGKDHTADTPDLMKIFQELSIITKGEAAAGSLQIGVANGIPGGAVVKTYTADLRKNRERFGNLGPGRSVRLEFREDSLNQGCQLEGYEIPFGELGRR